MDDLFDLLSVEENEINGILDEFEPIDCPVEDDIAINFHYIRFQSNQPRIKHFVSKLCDHIIHYCLNREKHQNITSKSFRQIYLEAKRKFSEPSDSRTGEPGELIVFFMLEGYLRVPKIFSKMSLKTNKQMHVHGADGVHLGLDGNKLILYFGESKLYQVHTSAISEALTSIGNFVFPDDESTNFGQQDFEIQVLSDNLDVPEGHLRELVLRVLDPYSRERSNLEYVYTCFIGFDLSEIKDKCNLSDFLKAYDREARRCYQNVLKKIRSDPNLSTLTWYFFFIPFGSVDELRRAFLKELKS